MDKLNQSKCKLQAKVKKIVQKFFAQADTSNLNAFNCSPVRCRPAGSYPVKSFLWGSRFIELLCHGASATRFEKQHVSSDEEHQAFNAYQVHLQQWETLWSSLSTAFSKTNHTSFPFSATFSLHFLARLSAAALNHVTHYSIKPCHGWSADALLQTTAVRRQVFSAHMQRSLSISHLKLQLGAMCDVNQSIPPGSFSTAVWHHDAITAKKRMSTLSIKNECNVM